MNKDDMLTVFGLELMEELLPESTTDPESALSLTRSNGAWGENE